MAEYFVTGATGFIGGEVARQLTANGHKVRALVRDPGKAGALRAMGAALVEGDISSKDNMRAGMEGADGVFHIAGWYKVGVEDKSPGQKVNVEGTRNVLEAMRDTGVPKGVYTSTLAAFGDTKGQLADESFKPTPPFKSEYDRTKSEAHFNVAEPMMRDGLPLVIVQPGLVYGPGDTSSFRPALLDFLQGKLKRTPAGAAYCWGHIEDTARGHLFAMEKGRPGEAYILAGPAHTLVEAFDKIAAMTGLPAVKSHPSPRMLRTIASIMSFVSKFKEVSEAFSPENLRVLAGTTYLGNSAKAQRELGFAPRPFDVGMAATVAHEMALSGMPPPKAPA